MIAANIAAAFLTVLQPDLIDKFGFHPNSPQVIAALTCLFLHANILHLLGNMVFLAAAGPATETAVGSLRFFGVYLASGLAGVAGHWIMAKQSSAPLIGASGAVAGCVALGAVRFYRTKVPLAPKLSVPLFAIVVVWLLLQILGGTVQIGEQAIGTSYWSHVGGIAAGLLLALAFRASRDADQAESSRLLTEMQGRSPAATLAALDQYLERHAGNAALHLQRTEALAKLGEHRRAADALQRAMELARAEDFGRIGEVAVACGCLTEVSSKRKLALAARISKDSAENARTLLESVARGGADDPDRPDALLSLIELDMDQGGQSSSGWIQELLEKYPLHPAAEVARQKGWKS